MKYATPKLTLFLIACLVVCSLSFTGLLTATYDDEFVLPHDYNRNGVYDIGDVQIMTTHDIFYHSGVRVDRSNYMYDINGDDIISPRDIRTQIHSITHSWHPGPNGGFFLPVTVHCEIGDYDLNGDIDIDDYTYWYNEYEHASSVVVLPGYVGGDLDGSGGPPNQVDYNMLRAKWTRGPAPADVWPPQPPGDVGN